MTYTIRSVFGDYNDNGDDFDGIFVITAPDGADVPSVIKETKENLNNFIDIFEDYEEFEDLMESPEESLAEDFEPYYVEVRKFVEKVTKKGIALNELRDWDVNNYGGSLESTLALIEKIEDGWKYDYLHIDDTYDADNNCMC